MPRKYRLKCPVARTLDIIGDRWTILILRDLFLHQTRRFQDFETTLPGLTPSVLSARLKDLESNSIISSRNYTDHPPRLEYFLSSKGRELGPILQALKKWGENMLDEMQKATAADARKGRVRQALLTGPILGTLLKLCWPTILVLVVQTLVGVAETIGSAFWARQRWLA